jgi:lipopolysaccharide biosynthesis glycosyltransferase
VAERAVVFAADEAFALGLAVALSSTLRHLARDCSAGVYVLDNGLAEASRQRLGFVGRRIRPDLRLSLLRVPPGLIDGLQVPKWLSTSTFARLLIPELLPPEVSRAVYIDADVLVRKDISPLFTHDLGGAPVGGVRDAAIISTDHEMSGIRERQPPRPYFNTGVLVIDAHLWRESRLGQRALEYAVGAGDLPFPDQDAINAVCDAWHELDPRWNVQHSKVLPPRGRYRSAAVWHFIGGKPWNPELRTPGTYAWVVALARSGWFNGSQAARWIVRWIASRVWLRLPHRGS